MFEKAIILSPCAFSTIQNKDDLKSVSPFAPEWLNIFTLADGVGDLFAQLLYSAIMREHKTSVIAKWVINSSYTLKFHKTVYFCLHFGDFL